MIDTDNYEGHTPAPWKRAKAKITTQFCGDEIIVNTGETSWEADMHLIADAPLLLAEVIRLREELKQTRESLWWCYDNYRFDGHPMTDVDWNFIGNLLGADMESEEE